jgi:hypothetical protein
MRVTSANPTQMCCAHLPHEERATTHVTFGPSRTSDPCMGMEKEEKTLTCTEFQCFLRKVKPVRTGEMETSQRTKETYSSSILAAFSSRLGTYSAPKCSALNKQVTCRPRIDWSHLYHRARRLQFVEILWWIIQLWPIRFCRGFLAEFGKLHSKIRSNVVRGN